MFEAWRFNRLIISGTKISLFDDCREQGFIVVVVGKEGCSPGRALMRLAIECAIAPKVISFRYPHRDGPEDVDSLAPRGFYFRKPWICDGDQHSRKQHEKEYETIQCGEAQNKLESALRWCRISTMPRA